MSIHGFPPIARKDACVLILGSMPSVASLEKHQYYGHPQNAFWPIMCQLFDCDPKATYAQRKISIRKAGVAVWDVMSSCKREGSLDASIEEASIVPNDFLDFLRTHPDIHHIFFNGSKAEQAFRRYVLPELTDSAIELAIEYARLPSTSPAMATLNRRQKLEAWKLVKQSAELSSVRN